MFDSIRFAVPVLFMMVCLCSCVRREFTQEEMEELVRKIQRTDENIPLNRYDSVEKGADEILSFCRKVKPNDEVYYAVSFARNMKGLCCSRRGDESAAEEYYISALKTADKISKNQMYWVPAKSFIYRNLVALHARHPEKRDIIFAQWEALFRSYYDSDISGKKSRPFLDIVLTHQWAMIDTKTEFLIECGKLDEAEKLIKNYLDMIFGFYSEPEKKYEWTILLYDQLAEIYHKKNNIPQMNFWIGKCLTLSNKGGHFPFSCYLILIRQSQKDGKWDKAVEYCRKGMELCDKDHLGKNINVKGRLLLLLADSYFQAGDFENAKKAFLQAESMNPPPDFQKEIRTKLKKNL